MLNQVDAVMKNLAPQGELRIALNYGNTALAQRGKDGVPLGVTADLARELARRLGVVPRFISYDAAAKVAAAVEENAWDIAFMAIDPKRAEKIDFTEAYVLIEGTYMVKDTAPWLQVEELDREGVRIAVGQGAAYDLFLSRHLQHAELVKFSTSAAAIHGFVEQGLEAVAGVRQTLQAYAAEHPGYRILDGHFTAIHQAMALPKGRDVALQYVTDFIKEMKANGFVAEALQRSGQGGATVAP
ncbi:MAG: ABC transporter substrate-binding protein [Alcaligenaceae bacterium]|nr:ABC transporter substrate-binding protein [Alcaligenaceae bacterium]